MIIAKNARMLLDGKLKDARNAMGFASDRSKKAALAAQVASLTLRSIVSAHAPAR
jgi:hypothetical protein